MRADEDDDGQTAQTSAFRCLDVVRYTVAAVMTVLIVAVIVISIKVVLRPEHLRLSVVDGTVYSTPQPASGKVILKLNLRANNPSGRAHMYFYNVTAYLFDSATPASTSKPDEDCIFNFKSTDKDVLPQMVVDSFTRVQADPRFMDQEYFDKLYKGGVIDNMTLRVDGRLVTAVSSRFNVTNLQVSYYCWPLLVGEASNGRKDVLCTDNMGSQ